MGTGQDIIYRQRIISVLNKIKHKNRKESITRHYIY